ncbi:MAG: iron-containing redox enzyme family protein [Mycobacterium sp.]|uniref:iron-containing redox enzyme family protein n=1 Tax=Mycobacterium sp. TaxID=1785 RepID=UPI001EC365D1|nr:iron-containing redox enzyme family protein [Mycobacterium sp.]MBV8787548.1 iron-containing redox enzyme family protein [Mycobacterium sp.]
MIAPQSMTMKPDANHDFEGGLESADAVSPLVDELFVRLGTVIDGLWSVARDGRFWTHVLQHGFDRSLYRSVMVQIFHYTRHNSINQAVATFGAAPEQIGLLRFAYTHAREELGHEKLVLHDLRAIGLLGSDETIVDPPLPATDALINYLYGVSLREGLVARLGYSYWAESVYVHIAPLLARARGSLNLTDREMAFFVAHAEIDSKHAVEVERAIRGSVRTQADADAVFRVATTSLWLTVMLIEQAFDEWALDC